MPTATTPAQVGRFRFTEIHGMESGDVVPTLDVMLRHVHPDDRERVIEVIERHAPGGEPFGCQYRLLQLSGAERTVTLTGLAEPQEGATGVTGFLVDVTSAQRDLVAHHVNAELTQALQSHAVIDQAKGVFMLGYGVDEDSAFELLRWGSQQRNVRLLTLAQRLVTAVESSGGLGPDARHRLDDFFFVSLGDGAQTPPAPAGREGLHVAFSMAEGVPVAAVEGPVDLATSGELTVALAQLLRKGRRAGTMVVDLRRVSHLGSVGVSVLTAAHRRSAAVGVRMRIVLGPDTSLGLAGAHGLDVMRETGTVHAGPRPSQEQESSPT
jgi:anti-anti-sigma factor